MTEAEIYLSQHDSLLGEIIRRNGTIAHTANGNYFAALASSIISQQISVKAAAKIFDRFKKATNLDPEKVFELDESQQKTIGLSGQKLRYLQSLAEHFLQNSAIFDHLETLSDEAVIIELTRVKGIGVWTAQMFLMFTLQRPDVFAPDDRGLQLAVERLYDLQSTPTRSELEDIAKRWKPFRTTASFHLWRSLDNQPI